MAELRSGVQGRVLAISDRDLLVGKVGDIWPVKATDGTAIPNGSTYLERDDARGVVQEFVYLSDGWVFQRSYHISQPIESLLAEQVGLLKQMVAGLSLLCDTDLNDEA